MGSTERDRFSGGRGRLPPAAPGGERPRTVPSVSGSCCWVRSPFSRRPAPRSPSLRRPAAERQRGTRPVCRPRFGVCMTSVSLLCPGAPARSPAGFSRPAECRRPPRPAHSPATKGSRRQGKRAEEGDGLGGKRGSSRVLGLCSGWSGLLLCQQWSIITRMTLGQGDRHPLGPVGSPMGAPGNPGVSARPAHAQSTGGGRSCSPLGAIPRVRDQGSALPEAGQKGALLRPDGGPKGPGLHTPLKPAGDGAGFLSPPEPHSSLAGLGHELASFWAPFPPLQAHGGRGDGGCVSSAQPPERQV